MKYNLLLLLLFFSTFSFGQVIVDPIIKKTDGHTIKESTDHGMKIITLKYTPSPLFTSGDTVSCFRLYPWGNLLCTTFKIKSKDNDLVLLLHNSYAFTKQDSVALHSIYPDYKHYGANATHLYRIEEDLQASLLRDRENIKINFKDYAYFYPHQYAVNTFNADTVISYDVSFHDKFSKKIDIHYKKCKALLIQKNEKGYIVLYCCYNDDKLFDRYLGEIGKMFKFE